MVKKALDVGTARVFRNIDHLAFIGGGKRARKIKSAFKDELNPELAERGIFDWMLFDIGQCDDNMSQIAREEGASKATPED